MGDYFYKQLNAMDCGPTCLRIVSKFYGRYYSGEKLRQLAGLSKEGVSLLGLSEAAEKLGFRSRGVQVSYQQLTEEVELPAILHWDQNHFVVILPQTKAQRRKKKVKIADPGKGILVLSKDEFCDHWITATNESQTKIGTALILEPSARFYEEPGEKKEGPSWSMVIPYLKKAKWQFSQILVTLLITSLFQLVFPFLTQSIVDVGINTQNLQYITIVLIAQLMLIFSRTFIDFIRSRLLLNISININFSLLSDFWIKLTRLPLNYFDVYHTGDTLQRLGDTKKIELFLTGTALNTLFSIFNFFVFAFVLVMYNVQLFFVFCIASILYMAWVWIFLKIRRKINYRNFHLSATENAASLQLIQGMQELKLNGAEQLKRWQWENIQAAIFKLSFKNLSYSQLQQAGALFINEGKNQVITFMVAQMVVSGQLTLGAMLAIQYIIGQLNSPIEQLVGFIQSAQDAKISLERLNEIYKLDDEEGDPTENSGAYELPNHKSLFISNLSFTYPGAGNLPVLDDINIEIPEGKTTAVVGVSGSGKTTLLKVLLKFYETYGGEIIVGEKEDEMSEDIIGMKLTNISPSFWRKNCGAVLQSGYIFNDTIAGNIALGYEEADQARLVEASRIANIQEFVEALPNGYQTKLGTDGAGISQGQKQRILIARAVYKNPEYFFLDEATNSLDANNEKAIVENLQRFIKGKTVVVVAHRLSTVKNADNIIVLHNGKVAEQGTHETLTNLKGKYFELVKNQLELGN